MSSLYSQYQEMFQSVCDLYYQGVQYQYNYEQQEKEAATNIQKNIKMYMLYTQYKKNRSAAVVIQRYIRGFLAKKIFLRRTRNKYNHLNLRYYNFQATVIQRYYRGYIRRKYFHDFYARKQYLTFLKNKNDTFKKELEENAKKEVVEEEARAIQQQQTEFFKLASNLHHLTSTHVQPGVYRPPYAAQTPKVFELDVESQIKATFKSNYTWKPPKSASLRSHSGQKLNSSFRIKPGTAAGQKRVK